MKKRFALPLFLLMFSVFAVGQTAKVVELHPYETAKAKQLHDAATAAQKAADDFDSLIGQAYTQDKNSIVFIGDKKIYSQAPGWDYGFEFSEDYKFIVPKPYQAKAPPICSPVTWGTFTTPNMPSWVIPN